MRIDQDAREANGDMNALDDETDLESSPAADVNLPPTGTHDTSRVSGMPDFADLDHDSAKEEPADD